ncbi:transcriptional regulator [Iodidimonas muriae]|uniref:Transcriptional regulator n=1 Tax=Iodidimonas muriae TaxID=261467 RepID=A0ABQ2LCL6_9PROT|nr:AraC family transcriptional regulator [Iodidimonas muriae]GER07362.1 transcriptional regulator [Kordiimonadales bacterium JCM 17843]GGO10811.1 transcriptional regulator [Iodidimonas muriae]
MKTAFERYHARMQRVLDHIEQHLDGDLDLDALSRVAAFSKFHFHRQFSALFGISTHRYVQLARMKRASYRLAFRGTDTVTDIALDAVYETPETFSRAFRERFGQSPSEFRQMPEWESWLAIFDPLTKARNKYMINFSKNDVNIVEFPETAIAVMEHRGDPGKIGDTIQRFIAWRKTVGLPPRVSNTFNVFHTDPLTTPPAEFHIDLCASTDRKVAENDAGVRAGTIPAGRCAVLRMTGSSDDLEKAATFLYRDWLPDSGEDLRDFSFYCQRISFFPDVPENAAVTDLFVPLK